MAYGTVNADVIGTSVANSNLGAGNASIMKNRIINGAMVIDQRNAGASVTPTTGQYTLDRWRALLSQSSKYTVQQSSTAPTGFSKSLLVTSSSAYSVTSTDYFFIRQYVEGFNFADCGWGTANAKTVTLSFWVNSSLTGTFGGALGNENNDRTYPFSYTISAANTWEQKTITVAGDTTGTWVGATNGAGLSVVFSLGAGSTVSGTAGAWAGAGYYSATGATSVVGTNGATFYITGVQLEVGSSATGFEYRQYGQELALCQRYYEKIGFGDANSRFPTVWGHAGGATAYVFMTVSFAVSKRTIPTVVKGTDVVTNGTTFVDGSAYNGFRYYVSASAAGQAGGYFSTDGVTASAEL